MAWEDFERNGVEGMTGDIPFDEFALAIRRIVNAYQDRFDRNPTMAELAHAFENVIGSDPESFVSDPQGLELADIIVKRRMDN